MVYALEYSRGDGSAFDFGEPLEEEPALPRHDNCLRRLRASFEVLRIDGADREHASTRIAHEVDVGVLAARAAQLTKR